MGLDNFQAVVGDGIFQATTTLSELTGCALTCQPLLLETLTNNSVQQFLFNRFGNVPICTTQLPFSGGLTGTAQLFFSQDSAIALTTALTGEEAFSDEIRQLKQETLIEVGNIVLNSVMGAISNALEKKLDFSVPIYQEREIESLVASMAEQEADKLILLAQTQLLIEELQVGVDIILFFKIKVYLKLT